MLRVLKRLILRADREVPSSRSPKGPRKGAGGSPGLAAAGEPRRHWTRRLARQLLRPTLWRKNLRQARQLARSKLEERAEHSDWGANYDSDWETVASTTARAQDKNWPSFPNVKSKKNQLFL